MVKNKVVRLNGPISRKREIPSILIPFFTSIQFVLGLDFGFNKILKKNLQFPANCFCCFTSIFIITATFIQIVYYTVNDQLTQVFYLVHGLFQYSFHVICLRVSKYNLYNLIIDMYSIHINTKWNKNKAKVIVISFVIFFSAMFVLKSTLCFMACVNSKFCSTHFIPAISYCILFMSLDVITLAQILIYYYIYHAAKYLNVSFEENGIKWVWKQFTAVANICDKIAPTYGRLVSTSIYFMFSQYFSIRF